MKKQVVRLTESDLHNIVKKSVYQILKENEEDEWSLSDVTNKVTSAVKGVGNMMSNGGGAQGFKVGYNNNRAQYMNGQQEQADNQLQAQIDKITQQIETLNTQKQNLLRQQSMSGEYSKQAAEYSQKANDAKQQFRNAWGAAPQQPQQ